MPKIRTALIVVFLLTLTAVAGAQTPTRVPAAPVQPPAEIAVSDLDARATKEQLRQLMQRYPPDLGRILRMDLTLMQSQAYMAQYPALAAFLAQHPSVVHNPAYYLDFVHVPDYDWTQPRDARTESVRAWRNAMEAVGVFCIFVTVSGFLAWLVRTFIDYRRWLRISKIQTDVHNKLLERFSGTGDLLAYIQSPAGRRFLESAPIPLDPGPRYMAAPWGRILWAVQAGVVVAVVGIGFLLVSGRVIDDIGQPLAVIGVLAMALGIGFILSGVVSYVLSRRLGLFDSIVTPPTGPERQDSSPA